MPVCCADLMQEDTVSGYLPDSFGNVAKEVFAGLGTSVFFLMNIRNNCDYLAMLLNIAILQ